MRDKLTVHLFNILLIGLVVFLPTVNAAPGDLDTTFSQDGILSVPIGAQGFGAAQAVAVQADGKIVAAGVKSVGIVGGYEFAVVRSNPDGSLDTSFDGDGIVITPNGEIAYTVAIQPDGKIIVAGHDGNDGDIDFILIRYNANGSLDTSFDGDGIVSTSFYPGNNDFAYTIAIQTDGKIVAAGQTVYAFGGGRGALARYNTDGSLDASFDGDGKLETLSFSPINGVALQTDGKIVAVGSSSNGANMDLALVRLNTNGSFDPSFDGDGTVLTSFLNNDYGNDVTIQADGKIVAAGRGVANNGSNEKAVLARHNTDGSLDTSFEGDGKVITDFNATAYAVEVQTDGKIVMAGGGLVRYNPNGSPDTSYGTGGRALFDNIGFGSLALDSIGRVVVGGRSNDWLFTIARVLGDVSPNANVSVSGRVLRANGNGISYGFISLTDSAGNTRIARTNPFGYYRFSNVPTGTAVISVSSKRYTFANPTQTINLTNSRSDVDFTAIE